MLDKTADLEAFLAEDALLAWNWKTVNCCWFGANWVRRRTGKDPAEGLRHQVNGVRSARRLIRREGGFVPAVRERLDRLGFAETDTPQLGDVGIVLAPVALSIGRFADAEGPNGELGVKPEVGLPVTGAIMAIHNGFWWICRSLNGHRASTSFSQIAAWRID